MPEAVLVSDNKRFPALQQFKNPQLSLHMCMTFFNIKLNLVPSSIGVG